MGFVAFGIALRLLVFAATRHEGRNPLLLKLMLWGAGMFFPGFIFTVPLTVFCASRIWGWNDRQTPDVALFASAGLGVVSATVSVAWMLKKHHVQRTTAHKNGTYLTITLVAVEKLFLAKFAK
jgi:hypothetical protein